MEDITKMTLQELQKAYTLKDTELISANAKIGVITESKQTADNEIIKLTQAQNVLKDENTKLFLQVTNKVKQEDKTPEQSFDTINEQLRKELS